jgi:hypothetical protein
MKYMSIICYIIEKSNNIVMFNVEKEPNDNGNLPMCLAGTILKAPHLNISILHAI